MNKTKILFQKTAGNSWFPKSFESEPGGWSWRVELAGGTVIKQKIELLLHFSQKIHNLRSCRLSPKSRGGRIRLELEVKGKV